MKTAPPQIGLSTDARFACYMSLLWRGSELLKLVAAKDQSRVTFVSHLRQSCQAVRELKFKPADFIRSARLIAQ